LVIAHWKMPRLPWSSSLVLVLSKSPSTVLIIEIGHPAAADRVGLGHRRKRGLPDALDDHVVAEPDGAEPGTRPGPVHYRRCGSRPLGAVGAIAEQRVAEAAQGIGSIGL
jgi:hypothetical protein